MSKVRQLRMQYHDRLHEDDRDPLFVSTARGSLASLVLPEREWDLLGRPEEIVLTVEAVEPNFILERRAGGLPSL